MTKKSPRANWGFLNNGPKMSRRRKKAKNYIWEFCLNPVSGFSGSSNTCRLKREMLIKRDIPLNGDPKDFIYKKFSHGFYQIFRLTNRVEIFHKSATKRVMHSCRTFVYNALYFKPINYALSFSFLTFWGSFEGNRPFQQES